MRPNPAICSHNIQIMQRAVATYVTWWVRVETQIFALFRSLALDLVHYGDSNFDSISAVSQPQNKLY